MDCYLKRVSIQMEDFSELFIDDDTISEDRYFYRSSQNSIYTYCEQEGNMFPYQLALSSVLNIKKDLIQEGCSWRPYGFEYKISPFVSFETYSIYINNIKSQISSNASLAKEISLSLYYCLLRMFDLFSIFHDSNFFYQEFDDARITLTLTKNDCYYVPSSSYLSTYRPLRDIYENTFGQGKVITNGPNVNELYQIPSMESRDTHIRREKFCKAIDVFELCVLTYQISQLCQNINFDDPDLSFNNLIGLQTFDKEELYKMCTSNLLNAQELSNKLRVILFQKSWHNRDCGDQVSFNEITEICYNANTYDYSISKMAARYIVE